MEKRQLLIVSKNESLTDEISARLSIQYEITSEKSIHVAFNLALSLLPDTIIFDKNSFNRVSDFKSLKSFKSTHFLTRSFLIVYGRQDSLNRIYRNYKGYIDEFVSDRLGFDELAELIKRNTSSSKINYWHECFMGMFNLMVKPIVLLQQNSIVAMNDAFKKTFRMENVEGLKLTDFVNVDNKAKVKTSLRNFARGKHMKAVTSTALLINDNKLRNARISFSKLSKKINDQFIMIIDFYDEDHSMNDAIGTHSKQVEKCFKENSELTDFSFTKREKEIISLLCKGYKTKEISEALFISPKTIEKHRSNIIKRTNSETILESIIYAINHKLVDYPMS